MASIKWIKITTDMFENRKIKYLRKLPNGNIIVLIWIMLLTMAGKCNSGGMVYLTEDIPYSIKMLADELDLKDNIVQSALEALEKCDMISRCNDYISISGWGEYQNTDGMSKVREQNRKRIAKYREKQKASDTDRYSNAPCNVTCNVTVTEGNAADKDKEKEEEIDKELDTAIAVTPNPCCCNAPNDRPSFDTVEVYATNNLLPLSPRNMEELADFKADLPEELIRHAIDESCAAGVRKWIYARKIMESYRENGYKTIGEALAAKDARKSKPSGKQPQNMNYQQHSYTDSDFESVFYNPEEDYKHGLG